MVFGDASDSGAVTIVAYALPAASHSLTEVRALGAAATERYRPVIMTLAWTGVRVSEALGLRWEDVDFEAREIRVRGQLDREGKYQRPKTKAGVRSMPLLPVLEAALREHRKNHLAVGIVAPEQ
jgi:integrase